MNSASLTDDELVLLEASARDHSQLVTVTVTGCAFSCCGRGWQRKDGYEQTYTGWIDNLKLPEYRREYIMGSDEQTEPYLASHGTFMLYSSGIGGLSYVIACRFFEIAAVQRPAL